MESPCLIILTVAASNPRNESAWRRKMHSTDEEGIKGRIDEPRDSKGALIIRRKRFELRCSWCLTIQDILCCPNERGQKLCELKQCSRNL